MLDIISQIMTIPIHDNASDITTSYLAAVIAYDVWMGVLGKEFHCLYLFHQGLREKMYKAVYLEDVV